MFGVCAYDVKVIRRRDANAILMNHLNHWVTGHKQSKLQSSGGYCQFYLALVNVPRKMIRVLKKEIIHSILIG